MSEKLRVKLTDMEIHDWSTEYTFSGNDCKAFSPEILASFMCGLIDKGTPVDSEFVICEASIFDQLQAAIDKKDELIKGYKAEILDAAEMLSGQLKEIEGLKDLVEIIQAVSCGEEQVAEDDSEGMGWIYKKIEAFNQALAPKEPPKT